MIVINFRDGVLILYLTHGGGEYGKNQDNSFEVYDDYDRNVNHREYQNKVFLNLCKAE